MKQILQSSYSVNDLIKIGDEVYLVISQDKIYQKFVGFVYWTLLLDMKGNFFEIDTELLMKCSKKISLENE